MANNSHEIKVSVVVLTYNQEETIERTLDSILKQEVDFPFEIIIGEDHSSDKTPFICRKYEKKFPEIIRLIENPVNKGLLNNYYDCLLMARGKYIADLAGDDFWIDIHKLKKQVDFLDQNPEVTMVHTDWDYKLDTGSFKSPWVNGEYPYKRRLRKDKDISFLLKQNRPMPIHLCTSMYRSAAFREAYLEDPYIFRNKDFQVEDLQLAVAMLSKGDICFIEEKSLAYNVDEKSLTGSMDADKLFGLYFGSITLNRYLEIKFNIDHQELINVYKRFYHYLTMLSFHSGKKEHVKKIIGAAKDWDVEPGPREKIIFILMKSRGLWIISRGLLKAYRNIRTHIRKK